MRTADELATAFEAAIRINGLDYAEALKLVKRNFLIAALMRCGNNQCWAATELGMHRNTFHRTAVECGLDLSNYRLQHKRSNTRSAGI